MSIEPLPSFGAPPTSDQAWQLGLSYQQHDLAALQHLHSGLQRALAPIENSAAALPHTTYLAEPTGERQRVLLLDNHRLARGTHYQFVGCVGQRTAEAHSRSLASQDAYTMRLLTRHPYIFSYSQLEQHNGYDVHLLVGAWQTELPPDYDALYQLFQANSAHLHLYHGLLTLNCGEGNTLSPLHAEQPQPCCCISS
jgi:hypothetical protein